MFFHENFFKFMFGILDQRQELRKKIQKFKIELLTLERYISVFSDKRKSFGFENVFNGLI